MKKGKYLILLILLFVVCSGLVTYALFRSNKSGSANVNAARWNVVFKNGEETISNNFDISLNNATWTNPLGNVASGKIAPGSSATFYITIDASNTETDVDYTVELEDSFTETDFNVTLSDDSGTISYSTESGAMIRQIPIQVVWNGNINDDDNKNENDLLKKARNITIPIKLTAAQKLPLKYTIYFNSDGVTVTTIKIDENTPIGTLPSAPLKEYSTFLGWFDENGDEITVNTIPSSGATYYAHWVDAQDYSKAGMLVYYDPVSNNDCNESTYTGNNTCYKWRVISTSPNTMTIQLDHNIISNTQWNLSGNNTDGPYTVLTNLANSTSTWSKVSGLDYTYDSSNSTSNYGNLNCISGTCTISSTNQKINNVKARLITGEEVVNIKNEVNGTNNPFGTDSFELGSNLSWMVENLNTGSNLGYWALSPRYISNQAFLIYNSGYFDYSSSYGINDSSYGARPVITINKPNINLIFNFQNGSSNMQKTYKFGDSIGQLPIPEEREDFTFLGWSTTSTGLSGFINSNTIVDFDTVYAVWQSNLFQDFTYDSNTINNPAPMTYVAPKTGSYRLEVWGAQGGNTTNNYVGGKGGYATGTISLTQGDELYVVLGGQGIKCTSSCNGGYNGGGNGCAESGTVGSGGGATHIGTFNSTLSTHNSTSGLYIVAAGGGGSMNNSEYSSYANGGYAGGLIGGVPTCSSGRTHKEDGTGGSQNAGGIYGKYYNSSTAGVSSSSSNGKFGLGGTYSGTTDGVYVAGGGGGFYGGGAGYLTGGTGGSSYIGGVTNGSTIDGASSMPSPTGGTETGHSGNGYARISYIGN